MTRPKILVTGKTGRTVLEPRLRVDDPTWQREHATANEPMEGDWASGATLHTGGRA